MRKPIIAGNWKMYKTGAEALALVKAINRAVADVKNAEVLVCPPFTALPAVSNALRDSHVKLGAQNVHWEKEGAFTGEISVLMLKELMVRYAIVGHSERREHFGDTNESVNKRAKAALAFKLRPIVCVGESLAQREADQTEPVVKEQVKASLAGFTKNDMLETVIAYEPVWAIGTGRNAAPDQAQAVHRAIRGWLAELFGPETAALVRIQYGGSVKPSNAADLLKQPDIDGALVGGASLDPKGFAEIVKSVGV